MKVRRFELKWPFKHNMVYSVFILAVLYTVKRMISTLCPFKLFKWSTNERFTLSVSSSACVLLLADFTPLCLDPNPFKTNYKAIIVIALPKMMVSHGVIENENNGSHLSYRQSAQSWSATAKPALFFWYLEHCRWWWIQLV